MTSRAICKKGDMNRLFGSLRANGFTAVEGKIMPDGTIEFRAGNTAQQPVDDWRKEQPLYRG